MFRRIVSTFAITALTSTVFAQHVDALLTRDPANSSTIPTGTFDFDGFSVAQFPQVSKFGSDLEEPVPNADLLVGETGFSALGATAATSLLAGSGLTNLPGGVGVRFDLLTFSLYGGPSANLLYWNGADTNGNGDPADDIDFQPATGVSMSLERGGVFSAAVTGANANVPGFEIDLTAIDDPGTADDETGFLHQDLDAVFDDGDGNAGTPLPLGIYVLAMNVSYPGATSETLYWIYNAGLGVDGEAAHDAAIDYVPEPGSLGLLALGFFGLLRRR